jgi:D-alanyl-lipoteichoic acid acyltransferase DltB (MBOAT superfamily)
VFYGWWDSRFLLLLAFSTTVDYYCALKIAETDVESTRKKYILVSLISNLGILGFFKYFNFFVSSAHDALQTVGWNVSTPVLQIILPLGISFYTFQAISYTIDVYRRTIGPSRDFVAFALSVCYFPHLVAGPIQRASFLLPQLERDRRVRWVQIREGAGLIVYGLFKKVGVADAIAPLVDLRFASPGLYGWTDLLFAVYLFAIQIYCDFSGYSDIARGTSKLFGIELMLNFDHPYFSTSITEFWRRWHISLSTWLREYLYIPLGGNRHGVRRTYRNLLLTMLLGGLWHGANWTFVVWGGLHGLYLSIHKMLLDTAARKVATAKSRREAVVTAPLQVATLGPMLSADGTAVLHFPGAAANIAALDRPSFAPPPPAGGGSAPADERSEEAGGSGGRLRAGLIVTLKALATFHLVCLAWIFFRADTLAIATDYLSGIVTLRSQGPLEAMNWLGLRTTMLMAVLVAVETIQWRAGRQTVFTEWHWSARAAVYALLIVVILVCGGIDADVPFIYFQF